MGATREVDEKYALSREELDERLQASVEAAKARRQARQSIRDTLNGSRQVGLQRRHNQKLHNRKDNTMTTTPITPNEFDLSDIDAVRAELVDSVTAVSRYTGLKAESRPERIRSASRIAFLASRIAWLEAVAAHTEELSIEHAAWSGKHPLMG